MNYVYGIVGTEVHRTTIQVGADTLPRIEVVGKDPHGNRYTLMMKVDAAVELIDQLGRMTDQPVKVWPKRRGILGTRREG